MVGSIKAVPNAFNSKYWVGASPGGGRIKCTFASKEIVLTLEEADNFSYILSELVRILSKKEGSHEH